MDYSVVTFCRRGGMGSPLSASFLRFFVWQRDSLNAQFWERSADLEIFWKPSSVG